MTRRKKDPLRPLTSEERTYLEKVSRSQSAAVTSVQRAKALQQLPEEALGGLLVATLLDQDVEDSAMLVNSPPEPDHFATDEDSHLVNVPRVPWPGASVPQKIDIGLCKLVVPATNRSVSDVNTLFK